MDTLKKITANDTIIYMLQSINDDKKDLLYKAAENYADTLSSNGNIRYRIKNLLKQKPVRLMQLSELSPDIKKLIIQRDLPDEHVFLNDSMSEFISEILLEWKNSDVYKFHNLSIRNKILFHGETGNGKTTIARHIARVSGLPFVEVNADMIIDSHIGNSGANIYNIFNKINQPCVLFWDEVDTIGRIRGGGNDSAAGVENDRMVNSILINIEKLSSDVIFIGATNRREILDTAFLRRFDIQIELPAPDESDKKRFAEKTIEYYKLPEEYMPEGFSKFKSYSDINVYFVGLARKHVMSKIEPVNS